MNKHPELNDSLDDLLAGPVTAGGAPKQAPPETYTPKQYEETCPKCRGTGRFGSFGPCFKCEGKGKVFFKKPFVDRAKARGATANRKVAKADGYVEAFKAAHAAEWAWIEESAPSFSFAASMFDAIRKWGDLTTGQLAAVQKCVARRDAAKVERQDRETNAPVVNVSGLEEAFNKAAKSGLKRPKLRVGELRFSLAKPDSKNPGAIYVKGNEYLGKVAGGKFVRAYACTPEMESEVLEALLDPKAAAIRHGRLTGCCAVCSRPLTNKESVELGIGPICASKMGW